jgi:NADH:ubiquinone oxidoreductase subunit
MIAMGVFSEIFSWWGGNTWSNRLYTRFRGRLVGTDEFGNKYYVQTKGVGPVGVPRRWVIFAQGAEATNISADWHGWMHYTTDTPPVAETYQVKPHLPNPTGTPAALRPKGSILARGARSKVQGDYTPWTPKS